MPTVRLDLEYDGTDFHGWQVQPGTRTVQGILEDALHDILQQRVRLTGAGRTDTGVHALGQVASFRCATVPPAGQLLRRLNVGLPEDVRVLAVREVEGGFSARHSARARRYRYQMLRRRSALWTRYYHVLRWPVDVDAMSEAANALLGEQDFTAFARARDGEHGRCLVSRAEVQGDIERVWFDITANRFLHNMVRRLSGALVEVGRGRLRPSQIRDILQRQDHSRGGPCLPAAGLFFVSVDYGNSAIPPLGVAVDAEGANP